MDTIGIDDQAGRIYNDCADEAVVSPASNGTWTVRDGFDGEVVATVSSDVLTALESDYDLPVLLEDGSFWTPNA
jgi:hypothetical protein